MTYGYISSYSFLRGVILRSVGRYMAYWPQRLVDGRLEVRIRSEGNPVWQGGIIGDV